MLTDGTFVQLCEQSDVLSYGGLLRFGRAIEKLAREATLEEAAKVCDPYTHGQWFAKEIRKLKGEQP